MRCDITLNSLDCSIDFSLFFLDLVALTVPLRRRLTTLGSLSDEGSFVGLVVILLGISWTIAGLSSCWVKLMLAESGLDLFDSVSCFSKSGSRVQKPPFPGSSFCRAIFLKHLFNDRLCRIEFLNVICQLGSAFLK